MPRTLHEVVFVDGVRTPFGKAGEKGMYAQTRADDLVIRLHPRAAAPQPRAAARSGSRRSPSPRPPRSATRA